jgi:hypothetical protein
MFADSTIGQRDFDKGTNATNKCHEKVIKK